MVVETNQEGIYFDHKSVALDIAFIESLTLTKSTLSGKPEPFKLLKPHRKLISNLLGWKRQDGSRLYRRSYFTVGRKNSKSTCAAALALTLLVMDDEQSPEIYLAAKTREQASIVFDAAVQFIYAHEELRALLKVTPYSKTIINPTNNGVLKALSSEGKTAHGKNPSAVIFDELWAWDTPEQELYDALTSGSAARRQPLFLFITTAGTNEHTICGREYDYATKVQNGVVKDPHYLPLIYEVPKDADWTDEKLWYLANPCLGSIVKLESLREDRDKALSVPSEQTAFKRLHCNMWVNSKDIWIPLSFWDACKWNGAAI
jgi:phage terminase large subunit-like protein